MLGHIHWLFFRPNPKPTNPLTPDFNCSEGTPQFFLFKYYIDTFIKTTLLTFSDCPVPIELIGNGFCNDEANNAGCNFDNGDCCGTCVNVDYCSVCECLSTESGDGVSNALVANGICNDETNTINCGFDGFDCCRLNIIQDHCSECSCYTSKYLLFE